VCRGGGEEAGGRTRSAQEPGRGKQCVSRMQWRPAVRDTIKHQSTRYMETYCASFTAHFHPNLAPVVVCNIVCQGSFCILESSLAVPTAMGMGFCDMAAPGQ